MEGIEEFYLRDAKTIERFKKKKKERKKEKREKMEKREEEVEEFVSWERKREFWFRIEFGVKRRPPPSGTCQPFRIAQHPFYSTNFIARDLYLRASDSPTRLRLRNDSRTPGVEHFSNESGDRVLSRRILDGFTYLILLIVTYIPAFSVIRFFFFFFYAVGVRRCINIGISRNVSRYDSIKNRGRNFRVRLVRRV